MNTLDPRSGDTRPLEAMARTGYVAHGVVYLIVGALAVQQGLRGGGDGGDGGSKGALRSLTDEPFGQTLLAALAIGLLAYAAWRAVQALLDADDYGTDAKGLVVRASFFVSMVLHLGLAYYAAALVFGLPGSGSDGSNDFVHWLMSQPYGRYLVGASGIAVIGAGIEQIRMGVTGRYSKRLAVPADKQGTVYPVCAIGLVARGVVFAIIGSLFVYAAVRVEPSHAGGTGEALDWLHAQAYGQVLLLLAAVGLVMFGLSNFVQARWRRVGRVEELE